MNGFKEKGLDRDAFGDNDLAELKTFDAFPKTKTSYTTPSRRGGQWTVAILVVCSLFSYTELRTWWRGTESQHFSVEKGISHELQLNLDMVVNMPCSEINVNIQDASGDRILAGDLLTREETSWMLWMQQRNYEIHTGVTEYQHLSSEDEERLSAQEEDVHVHHVLGEVRRNPWRKFPRGPRLRRSDVKDSCRVFGSLEGNKVQGDFHITARGHGYHDFGKHLDHSVFNFTHLITELSFGPHYPTLHNPLDKTIAEANTHFYKFQYFLSIVPTLYSRSKSAVDAYTSSPSAATLRKSSRNTIFTNQYAATSQSGTIPESSQVIPGIFFKYNIEPILLLVSEERSSFLALLIRLINTVSGVLVTGGWIYQFSGWVSEVAGRRRRGMSEGVLTGKPYSD